MSILQKKGLIMEYKGMELKRLPVSTQEFTVVRDNNLVYIDKTDMVWQMANAPENVVFFSRPRRFGKTMLVSTLEAYFQGNKKYFEGLKIMALEQEWKEYAVLRFDLSGSVTAFSLTDSLNRQLRRFEEKYNVKNLYATLGARFSELIETAAQGGQNVVCLFDEYDYPLQHTLFHQEEEHERLKSIYRDFFSVLKSQSLYVKFAFLTGITKFTQLSLFSVLNNIKNVSFWPCYQALCGVTADELRGVLLPYVKELSRANDMATNDALAAIKQRYDGYRFCDEMQEIYNPFSVLNALNDKKLKDYWTSSGNTKMLMDAVDDIGWDSSKFEDIYVDREALESNDVDRNSLPAFMYQSGYLTIKECADWSYTLGIPNMETRNAIYRSILPRLAEKKESSVDSSILGIRQGLETLDLALSFRHMQALVAETPYSRDKTVPAVEEKFQFILKNALFLCNCRVVEEQHIATGRIDLVAEHPKLILIIELKMTANGGLASASEQIVARDYVAPYLMKQKPVYTVAIEFDGATRRMVNVQILNIAAAASTSAGLPSSSSV